MSIASKIDHSVLGSTKTLHDVLLGCDLVRQHNVRCLCVDSWAVPFASLELEDTDVVLASTIGFPHGSPSTDAKVREAVEALDNGANELDMVANLSLFTGQQYTDTLLDIAKVCRAAEEYSVPVKVIIEPTLILDEKEVKKMCQICEDAGAEYVKACTGFNGTHAEAKWVAIMKQASFLPVKASGGICNFIDARAMFTAGASLIGTSRTLKILKGEKDACTD